MKFVLPSHARRALMLAILAFGLIISMAASGTSRHLSPNDRIQIFEKVWKDIDDVYYDPEFGGVNWQAVHQKYQPLVGAAKDDSDFYSLLDHMTGELHDAHTRFSSPEQWRNHRSEERRVGKECRYRGSCEQ